MGEKSGPTCFIIELDVLSCASGLTFSVYASVFDATESFVSLCSG